MPIGPISGSSRYTAKSLAPTPAEIEDRERRAELKSTYQELFVENEQNDDPVKKALAQYGRELLHRGDINSRLISSFCGAISRALGEGTTPSSRKGRALAGALAKDTFSGSGRYELKPDSVTLSGALATAPGSALAPAIARVMLANPGGIEWADFRTPYLESLQMIAKDPHATKAAKDLVRFGQSMYEIDGGTLHPSWAPYFSSVIFSSIASEIPSPLGAAIAKILSDSEANDKLHPEAYKEIADRAFGALLKSSRATPSEKVLAALGEETWADGKKENYEKKELSGVIGKALDDLQTGSLLSVITDASFSEQLSRFPKDAARDFILGTYTALAKDSTLTDDQRELIRRKMQELIGDTFTSEEALEQLKTLSDPTQVKNELQSLRDKENRADEGIGEFENMLVIGNLRLDRNE